MTLPCTACPLRRAEIFAPMTREETDFMTRFKSGELSVAPGTPILMEGACSPRLFTVLSGMGLRYKTQEGGQRQVLNFIFPGDLVGMQAALMGQMGHSVEATTDMRLCVFRRADLWTLFRSMPERAFDMTWLAAVEENFLGEALATMGQMPAFERIAWALVRLFKRAEAVGLTREGAMPMPFRQQDLADSLGLSLVHTNKTLARLRALRLARWGNGTLRIGDLGKLAALAGIEIETPQIRPLM